MKVRYNDVPCVRLFLSSAGSITVYVTSRVSCSQLTPTNTQGLSPRASRSLIGPLLRLLQTALRQKPCFTQGHVSQTVLQEVMSTCRPLATLSGVVLQRSATQTLRSDCYY